MDRVLLISFLFDYSLLDEQENAEDEDPRRRRGKSTATELQFIHFNLKCGTENSRNLFLLAYGYGGHRRRYGYGHRRCMPLILIYNLCNSNKDNRGTIIIYAEGGKRDG